jgi:hypothetical protein
MNHKARVVINEDRLPEFIQAYTVALLWSSEEEGAIWDESMLSEQLKAKIDEDSRAFIVQAGLIGEDYKDAGHDFALTRNYHGAGFWDGDWVNGEVLTEICHKSFPQLDIYVGDDGKLYS